MQQLKFKNLTSTFLQPFDRTVLVLLAVLTFSIAVLIGGGDRTAPRIRDFTWDDKQISAEDSSFILSFSRPMDRATVESGLKIQPLLPGKVSWAGRKMAYTLLNPPPYGTEYQIELAGAREKFPGVTSRDDGKQMQPFSATFSTRDRAFAYIGVEGKEQGRLILYNLTQQEKSVLTPGNLIVTEFQPYSGADRILFSAIERRRSPQGLQEQQLYTVTTGMRFESPNGSQTRNEPPGRLNLLVDSKEYNNIRFDLSPDGETIVVQRVNRTNPAESSLWVVRGNGKIEPLQNDEAAGDFAIAPDSASLAVAQGEGVAILPLKQAEKPLDFLPKFGMVLSFAKNGSAAAMVKFNPDYTRSLFWVNNQGVEKELLQTGGTIIDAQFDATSSILYCLLTDLKEDENAEEYHEQPYLAAIDLRAEKITPLLMLPEQRDIRMTLAPDNLGLLFDQVITATNPSEGALTTNDGQAIASARLWLLPLSNPIPESTDKLEPELLPLNGFRPRWLP